MISLEACLRTFSWSVLSRFDELGRFHGNEAMNSHVCKTIFLVTRTPTWQLLHANMMARMRHDYRDTLAAFQYKTRWSLQPLISVCLNGQDTVMREPVL